MSGREIERCDRYREEPARSRSRLDALVDQAADALNRYDIEVAAGGAAERASWTALSLSGNHVRYFAEKVAECDRLPRQQTLFEASLPATGGDVR
jgi:hypothetical protein